MHKCRNYSINPYPQIPSWSSYQFNIKSSITVYSLGCNRDAPLTRILFLSFHGENNVHKVFCHLNQKNYNILRIAGSFIIDLKSNMQYFTISLKNLKEFDHWHHDLEIWSPLSTQKIRDLHQTWCCNSLKKID